MHHGHRQDYPPRPVGQVPGPTEDFEMVRASSLGFEHVQRKLHMPGIKSSCLSLAAACWPRRECRTRLCRQVHDSAHDETERRLVLSSSQ